MNVFDYVFYRTYSFYFRKKDDNPKFMGLLVLTVLVCLTILSIYSLTSLIYTDLFGFTKPIILIIMTVTFLFFYKKYWNVKIVDELTKKYASEDINSRKKKGWLIVLYISVVLLIPMSIGFLRHNLGWDI